MPTEREQRPRNISAAPYPASGSGRAREDTRERLYSGASNMPRAASTRAGQYDGERSANASRSRGGYAPGYRPGVYTPRPRTQVNLSNAVNRMPHPGLYNQEIGDPWADMPGQYQFDFGSAPGMSTLSYGDFLAQARELVGDAGLSQALSMITAREGNLKSQADTNRARLQAMYKQLADSVAADAGGIKENATAAREAYANTGAGEQAAAQEAYANTQRAQQEMRARLGIEDAAIYDIATGDQQAQQYQGDVSRSSGRTAISQNLATANEQNALDRLSGDKAAVGLEGAGQVAALDQQLASLLAELQDEQNEARIAYGQRANDAALSLAQTLMGTASDQQESAYSRWLDQQNLGMQQADNAYERWLNQKEMERQAANDAWQQGMEETQFAASLMPSASDVPDIDYGPMEQFNQQLDRMLGAKAGPAANILAGGTVYRNNKPGLGNNPDRLIQELIEAGLTAQEAAWAVNAYLGAVGG